MLEWLFKKKAAPKRVVYGQSVPDSQVSSRGPGRKRSYVISEEILDGIRTTISSIPEIDSGHSEAVYQAALHCLEESRGQNMAIIGDAVSLIDGLTKRRKSEICHRIVRPGLIQLDNARLLESGVTHAIWRTPGSAPCGDAMMTARHAKLEGKRYKIESGLLVDKKRLYPGLEDGCRCFATSVIPEFDV